MRIFLDLPEAHNELVYGQGRYTKGGARNC